MVMRGILIHLFGAALLGSAPLCMAQSGCLAASEFQPALCPAKLPRISKITIEENGAGTKQASGEMADCSRFKLSPAQARRYFARAYAVTDEADARAKLDWSPCSASGSVVFANGKTAHWQIGQTQSGALIWDAGTTQTLFCPACRFKPFHW